MADETVGYKIHDELEGDHKVFEITDNAAFQAFKVGVKNEREWQRHPVTAELKKFVSQNDRHHQVAVKFNNTFTKVR